jgi:endonuclease YncB( thermonuclease family)
VSKRAEIQIRNLVFPAMLMFSIGALAETLTGTVVGVTDGDTITVLDANREQHKIRLRGIDAPEKAQPFGQRSKQSMSTLVFGKEVDVQWNKHDRYQRIIGKVMVAEPNCRASACPKTLDAGLAQLTVGLAWWYRKYAKEQSPEAAGRYEFAEQEARAKRAGLWADADPIPPWDWRRGER